MGPTGKTRIVQIHPTRKCNLSCKHCYSSSSPQESESLEPAVLKDALDDLADEGYDWVSFSGGEPLVYEPLAELLSHAKGIQMQTSLVSNGMLLTGARLDAIENDINALVMSLDGKPDSHNTMRNSSRAFETMERNLSQLRRRGISFGFLFTLTQNNLDELPWVVEFCLKSGASGLMIHPLENTGNATTQLSGKAPDTIESTHAWLLVEHLKKKLGGRLNIQLDLIHTSAFEQSPDQFFLGDYATPLQGRLAELLSVLVIEPDGEVVPLQYGFPREYSLGNLRDCRISDMVSGWQNRLGPELNKLSTGLYSSLENAGNGCFINWYERLGLYARQTRTVSLPIRRTAWNMSTAGVA
ncbi:radical SAM/SPASM domain-containing protein [Granulosicoccus antarcticus]|uniref:Sporulation killing factor maturation protein SkfB n=1 Tax=Granulosicoccus antarcticus IMCC3135 TaxID=1192854 RepID=A0A2Z2NSW1_9GAMM|nr:radical SAM/SPASM domain-containing protein [Granulosicoccus antarcticus]ASJ73605.1 Sporulation killing factor maturation protein SkfB [Granulosicoccus antarcticus IMCC3135]